MNWEDLSQPTRDAMEKLGYFGPTTNPCAREIKGTMYNVDSECVESTYYNSDDLRQLAAAFIEVAKWLDNRDPWNTHRSSDEDH